MQGKQIVAIIKQIKKEESNAKIALKKEAVIRVSQEIWALLRARK